MPDVARPWSLKGVPEEVRSAAIAAAKRARSPIGAWVVRAIMAQVQADLVQSDRALTVQQPVEVARPVVTASDAAERLALVKQFVDATGQPAPGGVLREATRLVRAVLRGK